MAKFIDITGLKFYRLTVLERCEDFITRCGTKEAQYICKCDCGKVKKIIGCNIRKRLTKSCGCMANGRKSPFAPEKPWHFKLGLEI